MDEPDVVRGLDDAGHALVHLPEPGTELPGQKFPAVRRDTAIDQDVPEEGLVVPPDAHEVGRWPPRIGVVMQAR